jgi:peptidoglycan/LPS O-acetylase OafA/YrhL
MDDPKYIDTKNDFIDFGRGFAMLTIVIFHFFSHLVLPSFISKAVNIGGGGVHLFIFASGYGLSFSKYKEWSVFYKRRFTKVLIPYLIFITLLFGANLYVYIYEVDFYAYLSHVFLFKMFVEKFDCSYGPQFWFVSTIIQFYLFFPIINYWVNKYKYKHVLTCSIIISLCYTSLIVALKIEHMRIWNSFFLQYLWEFVLGMILAKIGTLDRIISKLSILKSILMMALAYIIMALMIKYLGTVGKSYNDLFSFLGYFALTALFYRISVGILILKNFIRWIASFSYSLFLTHYFIFDLSIKYFKVEKLSISFVSLILLVALFFAWGFEYCLNSILKKKYTILPNGNRL